MGLKMEVELLHIFLFWRRTMISTVSWHEDKSPSCHETSKHMPHLPKFKVIEELNPKNGHFDNNVLKSLHFKTLCLTPACTNSPSSGVAESDSSHGFPEG